MEYKSYRTCTGCNAYMDAQAWGTCNTCRQIAAMKKLQDSRSNVSTDYSNEFSRLNALLLALQSYNINESSLEYTRELKIIPRITPEDQARIDIMAEAMRREIERKKEIRDEKLRYILQALIGTILFVGFGMLIFNS